MQRRVFLVFAAVLGCTSDLPAPNNYELSSAGVDTAGGLQLGCDDIPDAAIGAEFDYTPMISGADMATLTFAAIDLPAGLSIDAATGRITGTPTEEGTASFEVSLTTDAMAMETAMCELNVNPALEVDLELVVDTVPFCLLPGAQTLQDVVVEGTGDGTPITCHFDAGSGDGKQPAGISIGEDTCEIVGTVEEDRYGTWVFIVRGEQSGASVHVPYCVTNDELPDYAVTMDHSGLGAMSVDGTLLPIVRRFNRDASIDFGNDTDPRITVVDADSCAPNTCFYAYSFGVTTASQFEGSPTFTPKNLVTDETSGAPIGFFHSLQWGRGRPVEDEFKTRPWAVNVDLTYCIADNEGDDMDPEDGPCEGDNIIPNAGAAFVAAILMIPD